MKLVLDLYLSVPVFGTLGTYVDMHEEGLPSHH